MQLELFPQERPNRDRHDKAEKVATLVVGGAGALIGLIFGLRWLDHWFTSISGLSSTRIDRL